MTEGELLTRLRANPIFADATADSVRVLLAESRVHSYAADELVLEEGQDAEQVWLLLDGAVRVYHASDTGEEVLIKLFRAPAVFGEAESFAGIPFVENVRATEASTALVVPLDTLVAYLEQKPRAAIRLLADVAQRLAISAYDEKSLAFHPITMRLANHLLDLADLAPPGTVPLIRASQEQLATAIGATRRSVAKDMGAWQNEGILVRDSDGYRVLDLPALRRHADGARLALTHRVSARTFFRQ
ncbi:MAG: Crp/Fnr family transcriptional regulator [Polyangia bacterium]